MDGEMCYQVIYVTDYKKLLLGKHYTQLIFQGGLDAP